MIGRVLKVKEVVDVLGISRATLYEYQSKGLFPQSISLGPRRVGWLESDVELWLKQRQVKKASAKKALKAWLDGFSRLDGHHDLKRELLDGLLAKVREVANMDTDLGEVANDG